MKFFGIFLALLIVSTVTSCGAEELSGFLTALVLSESERVVAPEEYGRSLEAATEDYKNLKSLQGQDDGKVVPLHSEEKEKLETTDVKRHITATINTGHHSLIALIDQANNYTSSTSTTATSALVTHGAVEKVPSGGDVVPSNLSVPPTVDNGDEITYIPRENKEGGNEVEAKDAQRHIKASIITGNHTLIALIDHNSAASPSIGTVTSTSTAATSSFASETQ